MALTEEQLDRQRARRQGTTSVGRYTLAICAAGHERPDLPLVVCGLPPHHPGPVHRDVQWPVEWPVIIPAQEHS